MARAGWIVAWIFFTAVSVAAQQQGGNNNQGNQGNQGNQNGNNAGGILIDAHGIVTPGFTADQSNRLNRKRQQSLAEKSLSADVLAVSPCRKVSLKELAAFLAVERAAGRPLSEEPRYLAGLNRVDYIFLDPDQQDVILAGPAEGFAPDPANRMRGVETGRPTLRLDDCLVALRTIPENREVGCSIDPVPENLAALSRFLAQNSSPATPQVIEGRFKQMAQVLGMHDVRVIGVPANTYFARVLVEADYRMKRISIGLENPGVKGLRSHLSMIGTGGNSIQRWWFVPLYDGLYQSEDRLTFEFAGQRLQLLSQDEVSNASGERFAAATTKLSTQAFAQQFTKHFAKLAEQSPVFAELQNLTDWCLIAALLEREQVRDRIGWQPGILLDAEQLPVQEYPVPRQVPAQANARRASSGTIVGLVSGGVTIAPGGTLQSIIQNAEPARRLDSLRGEHLNTQRAAAHPWWWD